MRKSTPPAQKTVARTSQEDGLAGFDVVAQKVPDAEAGPAVDLEPRDRAASDQVAFGDAPAELAVDLVAVAASPLLQLRQSGWRNAPSSVSVHVMPALAGRRRLRWRRRRGRQRRRRRRRRGRRRLRLLLHLCCRIIPRCSCGRLRPGRGAHDRGEQLARVADLHAGPAQLLHRRGAQLRLRVQPAAKQHVHLGVLEQPQAREELAAAGSGERVRRREQGQDQQPQLRRAHRRRRASKGGARTNPLCLPTRSFWLSPLAQRIKMY